MPFSLHREARGLFRFALRPDCPETRHQAGLSGDTYLSRSCLMMGARPDRGGRWASHLYWAWYTGGTQSGLQTGDISSAIT